MLRGNYRFTISGRYLYSSAQSMKYVKRIVTVAVVRTTIPDVKARKPKA
jgi:hypothetical protein